MKKLIFILLLMPSIGLGAQKKWTYPENPKLDDEITNIYNGIANPVINTGQATKLTVSSLTVTGIIGTTTNNNACTGCIGEYVESLVNLTAFPTSTNYGDLTSISLTSGDWDVSIDGLARDNANTTTRWGIAVSTTSGNNTAGLTSGNSLVFAPPTSTYDNSAAIPSVRFSLDSTKTIYFKYFAAYSGSPTMQGRISARRMR